MKVILIIMIWTRAVATAEFDDMEACQEAAKQAKQWYNNATYLGTVCAPKASR